MRRWEERIALSKTGGTNQLAGYNTGGLESKETHVNLKHGSREPVVSHIGEAHESVSKPGVLTEHDHVAYS